MPQIRPPQPGDLARLQAELDAAIKLHQSGKLDEAEAAYIRILERAPSQPDALNLLGVIQSEKNRHERALDLLNRATRVRPKDGLILNNLGRAALRARRFEPAIDALEHALALSPDLVESLGNLIQAHRQAGNIDEAEYFIAALRAKKGGSLTADFEQARLFSDLGQKDDARAMLLKILQESPDYAPAWNTLARLSTVKPGDPIIDGVTAAIERAKEPSTALRILCYAAGKVFDDLGEYDRAFALVLRAKQQERQTFDADKTREHFRNIAEVFNPNVFAKRSDFGIEGKRPLFIVGMPRSGTSLAEQILASHPDVHGGGELEFVGQLTGQLHEFVAQGTYPGAAVSIGREAAASLAFRYLRKIGALNQSAACFTDKMPHNFLSLGLLRLMFKDLRVVHCMRHPLDTILSCFQHDFSHSHDYNLSLDSLALYYTLYMELMAHWDEVMGERIHPLRYEHMVQDQSGQSRALIGFVGLQWDESVMNFADNARRVTTPSSWQVRNKIYASSCGRWRNYEKHLAHLQDAIPVRYFS